MAKPYMGTKLPEFADPSKSDFPLTFSIYKGVIRKIDTGTRSGRVYVYIPEFGSDDSDDEKNWTLVSYASPFSGVTQGPLNAVSNDFYNTQQTYGFYMTPPDLGSMVLCCFPNGSRTEGYWFACINPNLSRYMVPAIGSVAVDDIDRNTVPADLLPYLKDGNRYPVGEWNQEITKGYTDADWINTPKPLHIPQTLRLITQGLDSDVLRGAITSSAQRDPVSAVFGFSTPGRPIKTQDAKFTYTREQIISGNFNPDTLKVTTRVGGHSLTMDDGDLFGDNDLVRLKTAAGHQILMHDTAGFIYISNSEGTAWVELTKNGDILIYGQRDMSIRTQGNLMMHSDRNISFNAGGSFKVHAGASINMQASTITNSASQTLNFYGRQAQLKSGSSMSISAAGSMGINSGGSIGIQGGTISLNGGGGGAGSAPPNPLPEFNLPDAVFTSTGWTVETQILRSINNKVPTHEPYIRGNISAAIQQQQAAAEAAANNQTNVLGDVITSQTVDTAAGTNQAITEPVPNPAPTSAYIIQTEPSQELGILNKDDLRAYMAQVGNNSGGVYDTQDSQGYQGKYQLGASALAELGYVNPGTPQTPEALSNPNNWTGRNGVYSAADFRASSEIQDLAMYEHTQNNYAALQNAGVITNKSTTDQVAGFLATSHNDAIGVNGTVNWVTTGKNVRDANGLTASANYNQGRYSQTQVPIIIASNASKVSK
jgi:hypothetical protein